jgi:membrane-associated phospholipid phosphatase
MKLLTALLAFCMLCVVTPVDGQAGDVPDRRLRIIEPEETELLDPAFEMIMDKLDSDLRFVLSSPVRITPKGSALAGLTLLGTLFFLNEDDDYLSAVTASRNESSDGFYDRFDVLGSHVPEVTAGFYLLGYFLDNTSLKSRSLGGIEAVAISALITAGSGYLIGHKGPEDSASEGEFEPLSKYHSMPDMNSTLIFSLAGVFSYGQPWYQSFLYYGVAGCTAMSRVYHEESWPSDVFLGSVLGTAIGRTIASRSIGGREPFFSVVPVLEYDARPAVGLMVKFKL